MDQIQASQVFTPPVTPLPEPKVKIWLWIVGGILLLGVGIVGGVFLGKQLYSIPQPQPIPTPSPSEASAKKGDPTANWKTYTDPQRSFSFKYPSIYIVNEKAPGYLVVNSQTDSAPQAGISIDARIIGPYENYSGSEKYLRTSFIIDKEYVVNNWLIFDTTGKDGMLMGVKFKMAIAKYKSGAIAVETLNDSRGDYVAIFDQILSTFKFIEPTGENQPTISTPSTNSKVASPLTIKGSVPAGWMFEGVFPIKLVDAGKKLIAQSQGKETIPGSWTNGKAVEFNASLTFTTTTKSGFIILENDNPSGLPEKNKSFEIPVTF